MITPLEVLKTVVCVSQPSMPSPFQGRGEYGAGADARPGSADPAQSGRPAVEPRKSLLSEGVRARG